MKTAKTLALLAVFALAFAGVAVIAEQNDANGEPAVTCFAEGKASGVYNHMMVFGYADSSIIIDTTLMTNLGTATEFIVELVNDSTTSVSMTVGPLSSQNGKIVIDASKTGLFADNLTVTLKNYEDTSAALSAAVLATSDTALSIDLMPNHTPVAEGAWADANGFVVADHDGTTAVSKYSADAKNLRNVAFALDNTLDATFVDSNKVYTLKGWSASPAETADIDLYPGNYTIEEIIKTLSKRNTADDAVPFYHPVPSETTAADGAQLDQVAHTVLLFAIYEKNTFEILLADGLDENGHPAAGFGITDVAFPATSSVVKASVTSKVDADSFGIVRIQQIVPGQYNYTFQVYKFKENDATGAKTYEAATKETDYDYKMVTNGVYKFFGIKSDLVIKVVPAAISDPTAFDETGYAFQIDAIENDASGHGKVKLSLDLYDYKPLSAEVGDPAVLTVNDKITISGTYFKELGDGIRAYGNLADCGQFTAATNLNLYIDNSSTASNDTLVDGEAAAKLTTADDSVYDLVWQDASTDALGIYAAQGVWTQYTAITGEDEGTSADVYTAWALFTA